MDQKLNKIVEKYQNKTYFVPNCDILKKSEINLIFRLSALK